MLGQPASSQTVCSPPARTSAFSSVYCGPVRARVRIHGGLRSMGVSALRTSRRSSLRPSGAIVTPTGYAGRARRARIADRLRRVVAVDLRIFIEPQMGATYDD